MPAHPDGSSIGSSSVRRLERRTFLKTLLGATGLVAASSLLAASGQSQPAAPAAPAKPAETKPAAPAATTAPAAAAKPAEGKPAASGKSGGKLEMFSWWTTGGEEAGLKALYALYQETNSGVEIINQAVAGAAGSDAKAVLKNRMLGGDPPDSFQVHMGHELIDGYVAAGQVEPLDDLYKSEGFDKVFPQGVLDIVSSDGHYWSVPV